MATLNDKNVSDIVRIKENSSYVNYIIAHKGTCFGRSNVAAVVRETAHSKRAWYTYTDSAVGCHHVEFTSSDLYSWLLNEYLNMLEPQLRAKIVKASVQCRLEGYTNIYSTSVPIFILSRKEMGIDAGQFAEGNINELEYFYRNTNAKICKNSSGTAVDHWARDTYGGANGGNTHTAAHYISSTGGVSSKDMNDSCWIRPIFLLPLNINLDSYDNVIANDAPEITANKSGNLGTLTDGFDVEYSVNDANGDTVTVTETLDKKQIRSYAATPNKKETFSLRNSDWISLANGSHTFKISATDGTDTAEHTITFSRNNRAPVITTSPSGNVGTLADGFDLSYSITDADNDTVTVTETFDNKQIRQYEAILGQQESFSIKDGKWLQLSNGKHSFVVSAFDGQTTTQKTITFTRNQTSLFVTLEEPFVADDYIAACKLSVKGDIPSDATCLYEVTNNALDDEPVWEDCTFRSKLDEPYVFVNKKAVNGFAFNFRVSIQRGASGTGGYITEISGGYE